MQGRTYEVYPLDTGPAKTAVAKPVKVNYFTKMSDHLSIILQHRVETARGGWIHCGSALLSVEARAFKKIRRRTFEVRGLYTVVVQ